MNICFNCGCYRHVKENNLDLHDRDEEEDFGVWILAKRKSRKKRSDQNCFKKKKLIRMEQEFGVNALAN